MNKMNFSYYGQILKTHCIMYARKENPNFKIHVHDIPSYSYVYYHPITMDCA